MDKLELNLKIGILVCHLWLCFPKMCIWKQICKAVKSLLESLAVTRFHRIFLHINSNFTGIEIRYEIRPVWRSYPITEASQSKSPFGSIWLKSVTPQPGAPLPAISPCDIVSQWCHRDKANGTSGIRQLDEQIKDFTSVFQVDL